MGRLFLDLRAEMQANDYTQAELARAVGLSRESLAGRMTGRICFKHPEMYKIAEVLGVPADRLPVLFPPQGKRVGHENGFAAK